MGLFSRTKPPSAVIQCPSHCAEKRSADVSLVSAVRQRSDALRVSAQTKRPLSPCERRARSMPELVNRFESYSNALPGARAAQDLNALGDAQFAPVKQPCLTRLPLDAGALNKALGINPASPNAIKPTDLRNDATGYRSAIYRSEMDGKLIVVSRDTQPPSLQDWKTNIFNGKGGDTAQ